MPFIEKQDRTERVEIKYKIRPEVAELIKEYAQYAESDEWYVVQEVLRKAITTDKEFQRWKVDQQAAKPVAEITAASTTKAKVA